MAGFYPFGESVEYQAREHARREFPREAVGCVLPGNCYRELINTAPNPDIEFVVKEHPDNMIALIHSHPQGKPDPSRADMAQQQAMRIPWGITPVPAGQPGTIEWFGDQIPIAPYFDRGFLNGQRDCWCLVRDWYKQEHGIYLYNPPRDAQWFKAGNALINETAIKKCGFHPLKSHNELRVGDVVLGRVGSRVVNHAALYLDRGMILHQLSTRRSVREPLGVYLKYCQFFLRHETSDTWIDKAQEWLKTPTPKPTPM